MCLFSCRFGQPNSKEFKANTLKYRAKIVGQLYETTMSFIESINANLFCFPSSLSWLVSQLYQIVSANAGGQQQQDVTQHKIS